MYGRAVPSGRVSVAMQTDLPPRPAKPLPPCVPFLPQDNDAAACDPSASAVVALLNDRFGSLLRADAPAFWAHLAHDASIANALDTYLQFRRRPHDARLDVSANAASLEECALARRVFLVFRRVGDAGEARTPKAATRSAIVRSRGLADPAKVIDFCALFGPDNPRATRETLERLAETHDAHDAEASREEGVHFGESAQSLGDAFASAGAAVAANLEQMADRVVTSAIDGVGLSVDAKKDALTYFHDVAVSLALLARHAPALARRCKGDAPSPKDAARAATLKEKAASKATDGSSVSAETHAKQALERKGKAPVAYVTTTTRLASQSVDKEAKDLGFVACAPDALCDALERVARETCDAISRRGESSSSADGVGADAADAVRAAVLRGRDALLALDRGCDDDGAGDEKSASTAPPPPEALASRLREARELFPDRGDGFLAAALECFGDDVNATASALFEGDLPPALAAMDVTTSWPAYWAAKNPAPRARGDGDGLKRHTFDRAWSASDPPATKTGAAYHKNGDVAYMTRRQKSAYGLSDGYDAAEAKRRILDLAYEDEYDDSFDELNELAGVGADAGGDATSDRKADVGGLFGVFGGGVWGGGELLPSASGSDRDGSRAEPRFGGSFGGRNGRDGVSKKTFWIENGRVYHAERPGATAVAASSVEEASAMAAREAAASAARVHGLGAGGNRAAFGVIGAASVAPPSVSSARGGGRGGRGGRSGRGAPPSDLTRPDPRPAPGSSAGPNRRGAGAPPGTRAHKSEHKASIGNHNRKQQAARKMSKGFGPAALD